MPIGEGGHGIDAGVVVGEFGGGEGGPEFLPRSARPGFGNDLFFGAAKGLEFGALRRRVGEKGGLDGFEIGVTGCWGFWLRSGRCRGRVRSGYRRQPCSVLLAEEDGVVVELERFVFDGAEDAVGEAGGFGPGFAVVFAGFEFAPPHGLGRGADFVEEDEWAVFGLEEDGVPGRGRRGRCRVARRRRFVRGRTICRR